MQGVGEEKEEELEENGREECVHLLLLRLHKKGLSVLFSKSHEELLKHFSPLYLLLGVPTTSRISMGDSQKCPS